MAIFVIDGKTAVNSPFQDEDQNNDKKAEETQANNMALLLEKLYG